MGENEIVAALKRGDLSVVEDIVGLYGNRLLRSAYLLCGNESDAQDLVQDTLVQAVQSIHRFRGDSSLYSWLHGILLNLSRHYHRERKRLVQGHDFDSQPGESVSDEASRLDLESVSPVLMEAMRKLSEPHREILVLRYFEEMKLDEIARHLNISKGTAKSRLHYAAESLRSLIPKELNLFGDSGTD
ncbi:MAG: RNA polymerase sigma factor [Verrucomicrobiae bacterium]|nr:RNA polymerase sigma factor [Verrucomicrobiae bacterium]